MTALVVSIFLWVLVLCLLIFRRRHADRSITYAAITIAFSMTLNIDPVYESADRLLGGTNLADLLSNIALIFGIFFLGRGVTKASNHRSAAVRVALGPVPLSIALALVVVAFALIDRAETSTTFMLDFGAQPAAAIYSIVQYLYCGMVVAGMGLASHRQARESQGLLQGATVALTVGAAFGVLLCVTVLSMDLAHVAGALALLSSLGVVYELLYILTFGFFCYGLASQSVILWLRRMHRERRTRSFLRKLTPIWEEATRVRPGVDLNRPSSDGPDADETRLHRQVVEIRDAMIDPRIDFPLHETARQLIDAAEAHLLTPFTVGAQPSTTTSSAMGGAASRTEA